MQTVKLNISSYTATGVAHASLTVNGNDVGMLYLDPDDLKTVVTALEVGCGESDDITYEQTGPGTDEFDYDVFDD